MQLFRDHHQASTVWWTLAWAWAGVTLACLGAVTPHLFLDLQIELEPSHTQHIFKVITLFVIGSKLSLNSCTRNVFERIFSRWGGNGIRILPVAMWQPAQPQSRDPAGSACGFTLALAQHILQTVAAAAAISIKVTNGASHNKNHIKSWRPVDSEHCAMPWGQHWTWNAYRSTWSICALLCGQETTRVDRRTHAKKLGENTGRVVVLIKFSK